MIPMSVSNEDLNDFHQFALSERYENASDATELKNPISQMSGKTPVLKDLEQYFFALSQF